MEKPQLNESLQELVREFHSKHNLFQQPLPTATIPAEVMVLRMRLNTEEAAELFQGMHERDIVKIADSLADLLYVTFGTAVCYGIPSEEVMREVHRSNMTKDALTKHNKGGKGESYEEPNIATILSKILARDSRNA
jgi:predicted HAD superfamily Cof-like phosphohydrolase